ncbi:uncharacterized protein LOC141594769 [Silene latifolia]|uniref:uncharacterized protein LOC141594769 n=1 Tax=Silene latifolia TaxID=37657 RepID=UPI003D770869
MDFISGLPKVGALSVILVIVDRFSKYATFIPLPKACSAEETATMFFRHVVKYWGLPQNTYGGRTKKAHEYVKEWNVNAEIARAYLEKASRRMKKWADQNRRPREFKVGDMVMVKLNKEQMRFLRGRDKRLVRKYEGPIQVIKRIGEVAYKLDRPAWMKCHPVFHVSCLKPYHPDLEDPTRNKSKRQHPLQSTPSDISRLNQP